VSARQRAQLMSITLDQFFFSYLDCFAPRNFTSSFGTWWCLTTWTA
jgi:hypothetical protein